MTQPPYKSPQDPFSGEKARDSRHTNRSDSRRKYPLFLKFAAVILVLLVALNVWLGFRRAAYSDEIDRLRASMTEAEREKSDLVIESERDKLRVALELARRQARWAPELNLAVEVDSGRMFLARDGALLREMKVVISPGLIPGEDTAIPSLPRGERRIIEVTDGKGTKIMLDGGIQIFAGELNRDGQEVSAVRVDEADMKAILPNLRAGMPVYFY